MSPVLWALIGVALLIARGPSRSAPSQTTAVPGEERAAGA